MALSGATDQETDRPLCGGCQCGAVRYTVAPGPVRALLCYCRMCQRATGNILAPLIEVDHARLAWHGTPAEFASSDIARRGFCRDCGTPLYYRQPSRNATELMAGTFDAGPDMLPPVGAYFSENRPAWADRLDSVGARTFHAPEPIASLQWKDR